MKLQAKLRMSSQRSWSKASSEAKNELSGELSDRGGTSTQKCVVYEINEKARMC